jgi:hypothetical protein
MSASFDTTGRRGDRGRRCGTRNSMPLGRIDPGEYGASDHPLGQQRGAGQRVRSATGATDITGGPGWLIGMLVRTRLRAARSRRSSARLRTAADPPHAATSTEARSNSRILVNGQTDQWSQSSRASGVATHEQIHGSCRWFRVRFCPLPVKNVRATGECSSCSSRHRSLSAEGIHVPSVQTRDKDCSLRTVTVGARSGFRIWPMSGCSVG